MIVRKDNGFLAFSAFIYIPGVFISEEQLVSAISSAQDPSLNLP